MSTVSAKVGDARSTGKWVFATGVVLLCAWVLVPIYFLVINAMSSPEAVNAFPKGLIPEFDFESLQFFAGFAGAAQAMWSSVKVAVLTMILSIGIGALHLAMAHAAVFWTNRGTRVGMVALGWLIGVVSGFGLWMDYVINPKLRTPRVHGSSGGLRQVGVTATWV